MNARYNIKMTSPEGKVSYLIEDRGVMEWRFYKCDQVIAAAKKLPQFAGFTFQKEMV